MTKYRTLVNVLDSLRIEAPEGYKTYHPLPSETEKMNAARSKALLHLFLKVKFGILGFQDRESFVTEGPNDGGIDAYYIDGENRIIYFIQSKFRATEGGFESREIKLEELLAMDIGRITAGETEAVDGTKYNSKIQKLIEEVGKIPDIGRYNYEVIIIANTKAVHSDKLKKLTDGNMVSEYNFERVYSELLFPLVSGTFFQQTDLILQLNLGNKTADEISYSVETEHADCEISVIFVPTVEIAKTLFKFKNSILKYNPRSYLDMASGTVNAEIANTILSKKTNEFALFNNGITMLSDNTDINKKIGKKNQGQIIITNPQIINGGQTAFTLSRIYENMLLGEVDQGIFDNKEVLLKIITLEKENDENSRLRLIEAISKATNQQTAVNEADRRSNDKIQIELQQEIFNSYGYFYQRKAGEFGEGLKNKYIERKQIIDREALLRIALAIDGNPSQARLRQAGLICAPFSAWVFGRSILQAVAGPSFPCSSGFSRRKS